MAHRERSSGNEPVEQWFFCECEEATTAAADFEHESDYRSRA
jgi:hypothetical protein